MEILNVWYKNSHFPSFCCVHVKYIAVLMWLSIFYVGISHWMFSFISLVISVSICGFHSCFIEMKILNIMFGTELGSSFHPVYAQIDRILLFSVI
jgi:hypothetical protein